MFVWPCFICVLFAYCITPFATFFQFSYGDVEKKNTFKSNELQIDWSLFTSEINSCSRILNLFLFSYIFNLQKTYFHYRGLRFNLPFPSSILVLKYILGSDCRDLFRLEISSPPRIYIRAVLLSPWSVVGHSSYDYFQ